MSRSRRKTSICAKSTCRSEKEDKQIWHSRERHAIKQSLHCDPEVEILPAQKEVSDPWSMGKDGKQFFDSVRFPKYMRK